MPHGTCSVCGAEDKLTRGMCQPHYHRWWLKGDPLAPDGRTARTRDPEERFLEKIGKNGPVPAHRPELGPCWMWTGGKGGSGYGLFYVGDETHWTGAHRWSYEHHVKPIPDGYEVDHLCHPDDGSCHGGKKDPHRLCVNPAHLAAVTGADNNRRSMSASAKNARKTHCINGHEFTEENTYLKPLPNGTIGRECRTCIRDRKPGPTGKVSPLIAANAAKTHCPQGHEYTPENTITDRSVGGKNGGRRCRTCRRDQRNKLKVAS